MSFINACCRARFEASTTGTEFTCPECGNRFIHDGASWDNVLALGSRKVQKLRTIAHVNRMIERAQTSKA